MLLHIGPAHFALAHVLLFQILRPLPVAGRGDLRWRGRDRRRKRTGRDLEAVRAGVVAPRRSDVRHVGAPCLRGDLVLRLVARSARVQQIVAAARGLGRGVRRRQVNVQHALVIVVIIIIISGVVLLGLGPQEIVEEIEALRPARSRRGSARATRSLVHRLLLRFADCTLPIRAPSPALLVELVLLPRRLVRSLLRRVPVQAILLIQPTAHLRPAPRLPELRPVLPVNVPGDARHPGRVRGGRRLLVTRRLARCRAPGVLPEVVVLDHRDAHVVGQGVLDGVRGGRRCPGRGPQQGAERPPFPVLLPARVRRDRRSRPLPLVTRRRQSVVAVVVVVIVTVVVGRKGPFAIVGGRGDERGPLSLVRGGRHRGAGPLSLGRGGERRRHAAVQLILPLPCLPPRRGRGEQYEGAPERVLILPALGRVLPVVLELEGGRVPPVVAVALAVAERRRVPVPYSAPLSGQLLLVVEGGVGATQAWA